MFVHDRQTGTTSRVSVVTGGGQANQDNEAPAISADGRFVVFGSEATNLVLGDANAVEDVFVHDRQTGITSRVSVGTGGVQANGPSGEESALSADGLFVLFLSSATNLVPGDTNGVQDVFIHDRGAAAVSDPNSPDVNGDGRADLVWRNTTNVATHVWQMTAGALRGAVTFPGGLPTNWQIQAVADVNCDGRADLIWRNTNNGATHVWQMTAAGLSTNWELQPYVPSLWSESFGSSYCPSPITRGGQDVEAVGLP